jgi:hypothetical protein
MSQHHVFRDIRSLLACSMPYSLAHRAKIDRPQQLTRQFYGAEIAAERGPWKVEPVYYIGGAVANVECGDRTLPLRRHDRRQAAAG